MENILAERLKKHPVIAAVKDEESLQVALKSPCEVIFLLGGNIFNLKDAVKSVRDSGKLIFIHVDLIEGFSKDAVAIRYVCTELKPDGIISTKGNLLKIAKELGAMTVQRIFVIDSRSMESAAKASAGVGPDAVEVMPGVMPKIISRLCSRGGVPIIAGGLVSEAEDVSAAVSAGALGVSTTAQVLWK